MKEILHMETEMQQLADMERKSHAVATAAHASVIQLLHEAMPDQDGEIQFRMMLSSVIEKLHNTLNMSLTHEARKQILLEKKS